jgi:hypothetical protein
MLKDAALKSNSKGFAFALCFVALVTVVVVATATLPFDVFFPSAFLVVCTDTLPFDFLFSICTPAFSADAPSNSKSDLYAFPSD